MRTFAPKARLVAFEQPPDSTTASELRARIEVPNGHPFPIQNLPLGAFVRSPQTRPRLGVAIGDYVLDLAELARAGVFDETFSGARAALEASDLNAFLSRGAAVWGALRARVSSVLREGPAPVDADLLERSLVRASGVKMTLPIAVADYVDFYSSRYHAENVGRLFRPGAAPLFPNWRRMPIGYHGRSSGIIVDGEPVTRPMGQRAPDIAGGKPLFGPSTMLDFELELGYITGDGPPLGEPLGIERARRTIFGAVLLNDWSARDLQAWENQPLGPFLSKAFATSISPWVVPLAALEPFAVPAADPQGDVLPYLHDRPAGAYAIEFAVELRARGDARATTIARSNAEHVYWSAAQQLAHLGSCGARIRAGDLFGTGTISGPRPENAGSLLELSARGTQPLVLDSGRHRTFLEDGDEVTLRGWCERAGATPIGFGSVAATIVAAPHVA